MFGSGRRRQWVRIVKRSSFVHSGAQQATVAWWLAGQVPGLCLTPADPGAAYYFLPQVVGKPIDSYRLPLVGYWAFTLYGSGSVWRVLRCSSLSLPSI